MRNSSMLLALIDEATQPAEVLRSNKKQRALEKILAMSPCCAVAKYPGSCLELYGLGKLQLSQALLEQAATEQPFIALSTPEVVKNISKQALRVCAQAKPETALEHCGMTLPDDIYVSIAKRELRAALRFTATRLSAEQLEFAMRKYPLDVPSFLRKRYHDNQ